MDGSRVPLRGVSSLMRAGFIKAPTCRRKERGREGSPRTFVSAGWAKQAVFPLRCDSAGGFTRGQVLQQPRQESAPPCN